MTPEVITPSTFTLSIIPTVVSCGLFHTHPHFIRLTNFRLKKHSWSHPITNSQRFMTVYNFKWLPFIQWLWRPIQSISHQKWVFWVGVAVVVKAQYDLYKTIYSFIVMVYSKSVEVIVRNSEWVTLHLHRKDKRKTLETHAKCQNTGLWESKMFKCSKWIIIYYTFLLHSIKSDKKV